MAQNIIFILTEGDHDAAFIYRILKTNGIATKKSAIKDYPFPLCDLFKSGISAVPIEELNVENARSRFMPYRVMHKNDNILSIYTIKGDQQEQRRVEFINAINSLNVPDPDAIQAAKDVNISILFFYDADNKGVASRCSQIKRELQHCFPEAKNIDDIANQRVILIEDLHIGTFVFTEKNKDTGLLEDILIPLMALGNEDIFTKAEEFLTIHEATSLFKGKVHYDDCQPANKKKVNGIKYAHKKSLVGVVGQLQTSGKSNTVCISDSDYLCDSKIASNETCTQIFDFIQQVIV